MEDVANMQERTIAYFSMEIGIKAEMPTYSGGLGVLAGDTIQSAADLGVPMVAVTLLYRKGYFRQSIDASGWQQESPRVWEVEKFLKEMNPQVSVNIEGREVHVRSWEYRVEGVDGHFIPVYFLETDLPENAAEDRVLTDCLYGGDERYRLCQEALLGIGGVRMLETLGYSNLKRYHMNEGHASLLTTELLNRVLRDKGRDVPVPEDIKAVRSQCVFTTHTPVPAGHDTFPKELVKQVLGSVDSLCEMEKGICHGGRLNMTALALPLSRYVNGVAKKHRDVSRNMLSLATVDSITNGVHVGRWVSPPIRNLFDKYIPDWEHDNFGLRYAMSIPNRAIWDAHALAKKSLLDYIEKKTKTYMKADVLTIGFARRAATYKRADLLFTDLDRLRSISDSVGRFQVVYAGKAHPRDRLGKELIQMIHQSMEMLRQQIPVVYLEDYDMDLGKLITAGVDVWLNTPEPPNEASGTSGMKAAINGVPSLSVLDGWWMEGHLEGVTGWAIGERGDRSQDADSLYEKLEKEILPLYYRYRQGYMDVMRQAIALNGSFFNTQRMVQQYVLKAYL